MVTNALSPGSTLNGLPLWTLKGKVALIVPAKVNPPLFITRIVLVLVCPAGEIRECNHQGFKAGVWISRKVGQGNNGAIPNDRVDAPTSIPARNHYCIAESTGIYRSKTHHQIG